MEEKDIMFSIVIVALNPGGKLKQTVESILMQEYLLFEIVLKDGMSVDGSVEAIMEEYGEEERLKIYRIPDKGIYDAMNQAIRKARGNYVLFLNCGDFFYERTVLKKVWEAIRGSGEEGSARKGFRRIYYGNTFCEQTGAVVHSAPAINGFTCYRNIPCHQSCFYDIDLFRGKEYRTDYRIRADYDHFLWCFYRGNAEMKYMDIIVSSYEGGGYSESKENRVRDREEHQLITKEYMGRWALLGYKLVMALTLVPLRKWVADNRRLSVGYHKLKDYLYRRTS